MPSPFSRTVSSLRADGSRGWTAAVAFLAFLIGGWGAWAAYARVAIYEVAVSARIEVCQAAHPVQATTGGKVAAIRMAVGQKVKAGDVLVELDATPERRRIDQEQARFAGYPAEISALNAQISAEEQAIERSRQAAEAAADEARAQLAETEVANRSLETVLERKGRLREGGLVSEVDFLEAKYAVERQRAVIDGRRIAVERILSEQRAQEERGRARIAELRREMTRLETERTTSRAAVLEFEGDLQKYYLRAPIDGVVAEMGALSVGSVIREGDRLSLIVPEGDLRVVAYFAPEIALGRLHQGQRAQLLLDGFPWAQFGSLDATVSKVSSEVRDGQVRVELAVAPESNPRLRLEHGMTGTLEVEVEQATPAALVLRSVGKLVAAPSAPPETKETR